MEVHRQTNAEVSVITTNPRQQATTQRRGSGINVNQEWKLIGKTGAPDVETGIWFFIFVQLHTIYTMYPAPIS